jgi:hypothetical protein
VVVVILHLLMQLDHILMAALVLEVLATATLPDKLALCMAVVVVVVAATAPMIVLETVQRLVVRG